MNWSEVLLICYLWENQPKICLRAHIIPILYLQKFVKIWKIILNASQLKFLKSFRNQLRICRQIWLLKLCTSYSKISIQILYNTYYTFYKKNYNYLFGRPQKDVCGLGEELSIKSNTLNDNAKKMATAKKMVQLRRSKKLYSTLKIRGEKVFSWDGYISHLCRFHAERIQT